MAPSVRERCLVSAAPLLKLGPRLKLACQNDPSWAAELVVGMDEWPNFGAQANALITLAEQYRHKEALATLTAFEDFLRLGYRYDFCEAIKILCDLKFRNSTHPANNRVSPPLTILLSLTTNLQRSPALDIGGSGPKVRRFAPAPPVEMVSSPPTGPRAVRGRGTRGRSRIISRAALTDTDIDDKRPRHATPKRYTQSVPAVVRLFVLLRRDTA